MSTEKTDKMALKFQNIIDSFYLVHPLTKGISMSVESPDHHISWKGSTGWADQSNGRKLKASDPGNIASITKMYVSAAILKLVEEKQLTLTQSIDGLLSEDILKKLEQAGYEVSTITLAHLNSHTSGFADYVSTEIYQTRSKKQPNYHWTREEQIDLALTLSPIAAAGNMFDYSDLNHLLLAYILEIKTGKPFQEAIRYLLTKNGFEMSETWFLTLEESPAHLEGLAHQFASSYSVDNYSLHPSFDLYGGGGLAATVRDLALFTQELFNGNIYDSKQTSQLLYESIKTADHLENDYFMGISKTQLGKFEAYGHGGFWGTTTQYFPSLNCSISIFLMERDQWTVYNDILEEVATLLESSQY